jgi:hypothetical protein
LFFLALIFYESGNNGLFYFFVYHTKKVTKKVTAIVKFAKTVSLRAKNLNIAIKPLCHIANEIVLFAYFPTSSSIQAIVSFFLRPSLHSFLTQFPECGSFSLRIEWFNFSYNSLDTLCRRKER